MAFVQAGRAGLGLVALLLAMAVAALAAETETEIVPTVPHAAIIYGMAFDRDGSHLATGDSDGIVKIWDARTRQLLRTLEKDLYGVNAVAFSPDGARLLTAGNDSWAMKVFDAATGKKLVSFNGHSLEIRCAAFSPDGKLIASGDRAQLGIIWDAQTGARMFDLKGHSQGIYALAFTPDGKRLLTASFDRSIRIWDVATGKSLGTLTGQPTLQYLKGFVGLGPQKHEDIFNAIAISPDGRWALSGSWGEVRNVKLWDLAGGKLVRVFEGQPQQVNSVGFTPDGTGAFATGDYGLAVVWDVATGSLVRKIQPHEQYFQVHRATLSPNGKALAISAGRAAELWDLPSGVVTAEFGGGLRLGLNAAFTQDGSRLAVTSGNAVAIWDVAGGRLLRSIGDHGNDVDGIAISTDGTRVLTGGRDNVAKLWDVASGGLLRTFTGHAHWVEHAALSSDGRHAATGSSIDGVIKIWDLESGKQLQQLQGHNASLARLEFSPDGLSLLSGSWDGSVILWDLTRAEKRFDFKADIRRSYNPKSEPPEQAQRAIDWAGFSNDGTRIMAVTHNGEASMWDARTGAELSSRPPISSYLNPVILSPDGSRIYWDANLGSVHVSDSGTGQEIGEFKGEAKSGSLAMATTADGRLLASVGNDRIVRIWDTRSSKLLVSLFNGGADTWAAVTPEGFFSATPKADKLLSIVRGLDAIGIGQTWQSLYAPDLVREALASDPDGELRRASEVINLAKVVDSGPAPTVEFSSPPRSATSSDIVKLAAHIKDRGKGIGRIEWRVNGITAAVSHPPEGAADTTAEQTLVLDPGDNNIEVVAYNARNILASPPARMKLTFNGSAEGTKSNLHVLVIGINAYHDGGWRQPGSDVVELFPPLTLAAGDARSFATEMQRAAQDYYRDVKVTSLVDTDATPTKIEHAIDEIAAGMDPRDTFILYVAAHGYSLDGRFYLIPQDYDGGTNPDALAKNAIGQQRLQDWIANKIHARKALILLDTCESGALTNGYAHSRTDGPASDAALGRLHEATGRPVLAAAAAGKPAFEGYKGHGVFTWALIDALYHGDANADGLISLSELVGHVQDTVPRISAELSGTGRAAVVVRGNVEDDRQSAHFGATGGDFTLARKLQ
jgi:WD40 repeat protein